SLQKDTACTDKTTKKQNKHNQKSPADRQPCEAPQRRGGAAQADAEQHAGENDEVHPDRQPQEQYREPDQREVSQRPRYRDRRLPTGGLLTSLSAGRRDHRRFAASHRFAPPPPHPGRRFPTLSQPTRARSARLR